MKYDLAIIGAGPAGLSASVYSSRFGVKNIIIGAVAGGLTTETHEIGNWLGEKKISGFEFAQKAIEHAKSLGTEIKPFLVDEISRVDDRFELLLSSGDKISTKAVLLAMGTRHRHLGIPGERELAGKGVSYCATCDGFFYKNKTVAVVGGSDSAAGAAVHLAGIAKKVFIIYRRDSLRAEYFWKRLIEKSEKIEIIYETNVKEIHGEEKVKELLLDNPHVGSEKLLVDGIFIEIGLDPSVEIIKNLGVKLDSEGYIEVDQEGRTAEIGIWAAGDITTGSNKFKQIVTAASEGAICAGSIQKYLKN